MDRGAQLRWQICKWPNRALRAVSMTVLGEDNHGHWLWIDQGAQRDDADGAISPFPCDAVCLLPTAGWWSALWLLGHEPELYIDITAPHRWTSNRVETIDLDLDIARFGDGRVELLDEGEFEARCEELAYPSNVVAAARDTAARLLDSVRSGQEPFGEPPLAWITLGRRGSL